jgi:hypothetical protein
MQIDHLLAERRVAALIMGGLSPEQQARFQAEVDGHLAGCAPCRNLHGRYREVAEELVGISRPVAPEPVLQDVHSPRRVVTLPSLPRLPERFNRALAGVAAAMVLLAGSLTGVMTLRNPSNGTPGATGLALTGPVVTDIPGAERRVAGPAPEDGTKRVRAGRQRDRSRATEAAASAVTGKSVSTSGSTGSSARSRPTRSGGGIPHLQNTWSLWDAPESSGSGGAGGASTSGGGQQQTTDQQTQPRSTGTQTSGSGSGRSPPPTHGGDGGKGSKGH